MSRHRGGEEILQPLYGVPIQLTQIEVERFACDLVTSGSGNHLDHLLQFLVVLQGHDLLMELLQLGEVFQIESGDLSVLNC